MFLGYPKGTPDTTVGAPLEYTSTPKVSRLTSVSIYKHSQYGSISTIVICFSAYLHTEFDAVQQYV